jgi:2-iminobutanoate/2-iminopropanoate deaminase
MLERITAPGAPQPRGPYSHAVRAGDFIYVSGQVAIDPKTNEFQIGTVAEETRRTLENIRSILQAAGASLEDVVKCSVFLTDVRNFAEMNEVYEEYFGKAKPARTTVQAVLPAVGVKIEIDCVAYKPVSR